MRGRACSKIARAIAPRSAFAFAFGVAVFSASPLSAQSFDQTYEAATCDGGALASDAVGDENPARIDAVGDATYAAALYANDASFYYMRQRLADDPTGPGGYASHAWSWAIDTDDNPANGFELVASLDGVAEEVTLLPAGGLVPLWSDSSATHAHAVVAGSSVGGGTDWFLTIAVPLQDLNDNGAAGSLKIWLGSSANASGIDKDWACYAGLPPSPAAVLVDAVEVPIKCTSNADCGGSTPVCDTVDGLCVPCSSDLECASIDPSAGICSPSGACVPGCSTDGDCSGDTPFCNGATNVCEACATNAQCAGLDADAPICDASGSCDPCASNGQCQILDPDAPICDASGSCDPCGSDSQCLAIDANMPVCTASGSCDPCSSNAECEGISAATPICTVAGACVAGCLNDTDCTAPGLPRCDLDTNQCVECLADGDCPMGSPVCDGGTTQCRACASDLECANIDPSAPQCLAGGSCAECEVSADCSLGEACDPGTNSCVIGCFDDTDCVVDAPTCDPSGGAPGVCVVCINDQLGTTPDSGCSVPGMPLCDAAAGASGSACATCVDDAPAVDPDTGCGSPGTPVCDDTVAGGICVECTTDQHCPGFELCASNSCGPPDHDGDGMDDGADPDADDDGILDAAEGGGLDLSGDTDMDGIPDYADPDAVACADLDTDEVCDVLPPELDVDGDGLPNHLDLDSDGDGVLDAVETEVDTDEDDTSNYLDVDSDDDGIDDAIEAHDVDADGRADVTPLGMDADNDGLDDAFDPDMAGGTVAPLPDHDDDGEPDFLDPDDDDDGHGTAEECEEPSSGCPDADADGRPDYLDSPQVIVDSDADGLTDEDECLGDIASCPDTDGDGSPDYLDPDDDGDGIDTADEVAASAVVSDDDLDDDGLVNWLDPDSDGDGASDGDEVVDENDNGIPDYLEPRDESGEGDLGIILLGGRGVGCHVGPMRDNAPTGVLLLILAFGLAIRRYRRN